VPIEEEQQNVGLYKFAKYFIRSYKVLLYSRTPKKVDFTSHWFRENPNVVKTFLFIS